MAFISFIFFNALNVIIQTIKSIVTIKGGKTIAALVNAITYGFYTYIVVLIAGDLPLWFKCVSIGLCNLIGVWVVKFFEEKKEKTKLWKIEISILEKYTKEVENKLYCIRIPFNKIERLNGYTLFNFYCSTKEQTKKVKEICEEYGAKYFVSENKINLL